MVLQDSFIFADTVKANISLHDPLILEEDVREALRFVQATPFIEDLPKSYNEVLVERGQHCQAASVNSYHLLAQWYVNQKY